MDSMLEEFISKQTKEINELKDGKPDVSKSTDCSKEDLVVKLNLIEQYYPGRFGLNDIHEMSPGDMIVKYSNIIAIIRKEECGYKYTYEELEIASRGILLHWNDKPPYREIIKEIAPLAYHEYIDTMFIDNNVIYPTNIILRNSKNILDFLSKVLVLSLDNPEITSELEKQIRTALSSIILFV